MFCPSVIVATTSTLLATSRASTTAASPSSSTVRGRREARTPVAGSVASGSGCSARTALLRSGRPGPAALGADDTARRRRTSPPRRPTRRHPRGRSAPNLGRPVPPGDLPIPDGKVAEVTDRRFLTPRRADATALLGRPLSTAAPTGIPRPRRRADVTSEPGVVADSPVPDSANPDVVLVGGGIMSATLASLLGVVAPQWSVAVFESAADVAGESSGPWNNAGTGHSALCELNNPPAGPDGRVDPAKAVSINEQ